MKNVIAASLPRLARRGSIHLVLALVFAIFFVGCGDDSSSSVSPELSDVSSSSSSVIPASSGNLQSSSSKDSKNSSSSEENAKESSSSVKPSSSDAKSSSSEEVKQSSSSVVASSSSVVKSSSSFVRKDYTSADHSYSKLEDPRDHRIYKYLTIRGENKNGERDSVTVMAENLNVGVMVQGADDQSDDTKIEKYCYNNDTLNCYQYGGLYQWAEAMQLPSECNTKSCADLIKPNHQGICPNGWRLLTYDDYYIVVHADENVAPLVEGVRARAFGGHNYSGYSLIGAGYNWGYKFTSVDEASYWFYPEESQDYPNEGASASSQGKYSKGFSSEDQYKTYGFSIRCVMVK